MEHSVDGAAVLDKAVALLEALSGGPLAVAELAVVTGFSRPTVHRLCAALEHHGLVVRIEGNRRALGSRLVEWAKSVEQPDRPLAEIALPALRKLRDATGESVQLYIREGNRRRCVAALESPHGLRTIVVVGTLLPLDVGSAGAVLRQDAAVLRRGWAQSVEEREKGVASVSAAVWCDGRVVAAVSVSGPIDRTTRSPGRKYGAVVKETAAMIEEVL